MALLETQNLTIGYQKKRVLSGLNLVAHQGELICLLGKNGCGKSTLLRTLSDLQKPLSGRVTVCKRALCDLTESQRAKLFSVVLTDKIDVENLTVFDLVALGRYPHTDWIGNLQNQDLEIIEQSLKNVNLLVKKNNNINELSDGEKQRAAIAKALAQDTPLVLLDEPTAHLDLPNRIEIMLLLRRLSVATRKCFLLSTHELDLALQMADTIWLMKENGVEIGIPEDLMLNGVFQQQFGNQSFSFDIFDGHFSVNHLKGNFKVSVSGEKLAKTWLIHALTRCGILIDENAEISIFAEKENFKIVTKFNEINCTNISQVLEELNNVKI